MVKKPCFLLNNPKNDSNPLCKHPGRRILYQIIFMNLAVKTFVAASALTLFSFSTPTVNNHTTPPEQRKIQVAILLDVSGSMQGLIEQAKAQLWNMVSTLGRVRCSDKVTPQVELALYEYGRTTNDVSKGYVKQLSPFTTDLDAVSKILFSLHTNGGEEYCGQVIYSSLDELGWSTEPDMYKVIFIAGNEDFLQGNLHFTKACTKAKEKGVIVNTIYCGSYDMAVKEHWILGGECGEGSFTHINHNYNNFDDIPTPFDATLVQLNTKLNATYVGYGTLGAANVVRQQEVDMLNSSQGKKTAMKRTEAKAKANVYSNSSWDMVDAFKADSTFIVKMDKSQLPDSLRNKSVAEVQQFIKVKTEERGLIQKQILDASASRSKYIFEQRTATPGSNPEKTLETEIENIIRTQVKRFNMTVE